MKRKRSKFIRENRKYIEIIVFAIIAFIVITSCSPAYETYLSVDQIITDDSLVYLLISDDESWYRDNNDLSYYHYWMSEDAGQNWSSVSKNEIESLNELLVELTLPVIECVPDNDQVCYRIDGHEFVEISHDGGESWDLDWKIPLGRKRYMQGKGLWERLGIPFRYSGGLESVSTPRDLKVIGTNGSHIVIVAMGKQGLLAKTTDGVWIRRGVVIKSDYERAALPSPYKASDFGGIADKLGGELFLIAFLSAMLLIILYNNGKRVVLAKNSMQDDELSEALDQLMEITVLVSVIVLFSSWILLVLWGYWIIPTYGISVGLSIVIAVGALYKWAVKVNQITEKISKTDKIDSSEDA